MRCFIIVLVIILQLQSSSLYVYAEENVNIPELPKPIKVVDFSNSFEELAEEDPKFFVEDNAAKPTLVYDEEMGQVLQLGKAIIKEQEFFVEKGVSTGYIQSDNSEYSSINISNPYVGLNYLVEYAPYEDVKTTEYGNIEQPLWEKGITISYWIKSPSKGAEYGLNSNVLGFTSERFQIQADDYAGHNATIRFEIENSKYTDEEKEKLGITHCGVDRKSPFYFEYAEEKIYEGKPLYVYETLGKCFYMNKYYEYGYVKFEDGSIKGCDELVSNVNRNSYEYYKESPYLGNSSTDHNAYNSNLQYAWTYSEMWLDASSSFYFENDNAYSDVQLNPNCDSYGNIKGMQLYNCFNVNSWGDKSLTLEIASKNNSLCDSPVSKPDKWHYVTVIIQNDWVSYYLDGEKIDVLNEYSSYGMGSLPKPFDCWKRFNKGAGSRYGYGTKRFVPDFYTGLYTSTTIMEWITMDCVDLTIGGGNRNGDAYLMFANTDEVMLKNIVFYDTMLSEEQIAYLAGHPDYYGEIKLRIKGDVNGDELVNAEDALVVLKHAAGIAIIDHDKTDISDLDADGYINAKDALQILKLAAKLC